MSAHSHPFKLAVGMILAQCRSLRGRPMKYPRFNTVIVLGFLLVAAVAVLSLIQSHKENAPLPDFKDEASFREWATNSLPLLLEWLRLDQPDYREPAFITFVNSLLDKQKVIKSRMGSSERPNRTREAYELLCTIGPDAKAAIPDLIILLGNKSERLPGFACNILERMAPASIPPLIEVLHKGSEQARVCAATALREIGPEAKVAIPALRETQTNSSLAVRFAAAHALASFGDNSKQTLEVILEGIPGGSDEMRSDAYYTLWRLGTNAVAAIPGLVTIITNIATGEPQRFGSVWALRGIDRCELIRAVAGLTNTGLRSNIVTKLRPFDHQTAAEIQTKVDAGR